MKLKRVRITNYRSIEDSEWVDVGDVTCLVGKNESGKTAFLQALHTLNPTSGSAKFDETMDYPSRHYASYKRTRDADPADVVEAVFELEPAELDQIERVYGKGVLTSAEIAVSLDSRDSVVLGRALREPLS
jgi:predicted ATP-dependent endonuclease of OLD family